MRPRVGSVPSARVETEYEIASCQFPIDNPRGGQPCGRRSGTAGCGPDRSGTDALNCIYVTDKLSGLYIPLAPLAHRSHDQERRWCVFTTHQSVTEVIYPSVPE